MEAAPSQDVGAPATATGNGEESPWDEALLAGLAATVAAAGAWGAGVATLILTGFEPAPGVAVRNIQELWMIAYPRGFGAAPILALSLGAALLGLWPAASVLYRMGQSRLATALSLMFALAAAPLAEVIAITILIGHYGGNPENAIAYYPSFASLSLTNALIPYPFAIAGCLVAVGLRMAITRLRKTAAVRLQGGGNILVSRAATALAMSVVGVGGMLESLRLVEANSEFLSDLRCTGPGGLCDEGFAAVSNYTYMVYAFGFILVVSLFWLGFELYRRCPSPRARAEG